MGGRETFPFPHSRQVRPTGDHWGHECVVKSSLQVGIPQLTNGQVAIVVELQLELFL